MYLFACAATLVLTFAALGLASAVQSNLPDGKMPTRGRTAAPEVPLPTVLLWVLRAGSVGALALTVVAGLIGTASPAANINMTLFWVIFLLCFLYLTALIGDVYELINPWKAILLCGEALGFRLPRARYAYPSWLSYWPAFVFYLVLIWFELLVLPRPFLLSEVLIGYSLLTFLGVWLFGQAAWFRHGEVFSVLFRLIGLLAPLTHKLTPDGQSWRVRLRIPLAGTLEERPEHISLVLVVLFMLSSTTYDGLRDTTLWVGLYWTNLLALFQPLWGTDMAKAQAILAPGYTVYKNLGLPLSPFFYLAIYLLVMGVIKVATGSSKSVWEFAREFAFSLIPIAFVYHVAHYYTALLTVQPVIPYLVSDPFGFGWNLLGLPRPSEPPPLDMALVWHTELALILAGHVASVYLGHLSASQVFSSRWQARVSEVPLLVLMVAYTFFGLFVLSLPLAIH
jgi:hypothetical protein